MDGTALRRKDALSTDAKLYRGRLPKRDVLTSSIYKQGIPDQTAYAKGRCWPKQGMQTKRRMQQEGDLKQEVHTCCQT